MPLLTRAKNNGSVPDDETIEALLDVKDLSIGRKEIPCLSELTAEQRRATNLVKNVNEACSRIPGDPYGHKHGESGNVFHPEQPQMKPILSRAFETLAGFVPRETEAITAVRLFFAQVQGADIEQLCNQSADSGSLAVLQNNTADLTITMSIKGKTVRVKQMRTIAHDRSAKAYSDEPVAQACHRAIKVQATEQAIDRKLYRYLVALVLNEGTGLPGPKHPKEGHVYNPAVVAEWEKQFRKLLMKRFWLKMSPASRQVARADAAEDKYPVEFTEDHLAKADAMLAKQRGWGTAGSTDTDYYWQASAYNEAAEGDIFEFSSEDVCIVVDRNGDVVFASFEELVGELFGPEFLPIVGRTKDLWSFFAPMASAVSARHISDDGNRALDANMDMERCDVVDPQNAKMYASSYGTWAQQGDRHGRKGLSQAYPKCISMAKGGALAKQYIAMLPAFYKSFFGTLSAAMRLMYENLAPAEFKRAVQLHASIPQHLRFDATDEDFGTLAVLADGKETNMHRDGNDLRNGYACMISGGEHTGGFLCLPELGLKVPYKNGTIALFRGVQLNHYVSKTRGEHWFFVYTTREDAQTAFDLQAATKRKAETDDNDAAEVEMPDPDKKIKASSSQSKRPRLMDNVA